LPLPAHLELAPVWRKITAELRQSVGESTFEIWLGPLEPASWDGTTLLLEAPPDTKTWVSERFGHLIETCARAILGSSASIAFAAGPAQASARHKTARTPGTAVRDPPPDPAAQSARPFHPRYSFEQFIIGDGNRLAHAAALAVAELPGQAYNPLFLHAPPGLGKTHLLHAIGNYLLAFGGGASVRYTTVEAFTNHFIAALGARSVDRFKSAYRDTDVLLIDDVQFLASKAKTEEEFFHTFNSLYESGRQLVITCDRLPRQLVSVEERLRERFESGLVADIRPPDFATRVAILRKRAALDHIDLPDPAVLNLIAERVPDNIRALEGALIKVVAHHSLTCRPIDLSFTAAVLEAIHPPSDRLEISIDEIQSAVAAHYEITVDALLSSSRAAGVAWPRQLALHLSRELTSASLQQIGQAFGGRSHATVLHACKRVADQITLDPAARHDLERLSAIIRDSRADRVH
jgi:chromosomal replication initiator protein